MRQDTKSTYLVTFFTVRIRAFQWSAKLHFSVYVDAMPNGYQFEQKDVLKRDPTVLYKTCLLVHQG